MRSPRPMVALEQICGRWGGAPCHCAEAGHGCGTVTIMRSPPIIRGLSSRPPSRSTTRHTSLEFFGELAPRGAGLRAAVLDRKLQRGRGRGEPYLNPTAAAALESHECSGQQLFRDQRELARHRPRQPLTRRRAQDRNPIPAGEEFALLAKALAELHCRVPDRPHRAWSRWQPDRWRRECHLVDRQLAKRSHRIDLSFPSRTP